MGISEIFLILVVVLILFGPEDLPVIARSIGKLVFEIRKATDELTKEFQGTINTPTNIINKAFEQTMSSSAAKKDTDPSPSETQDSKTDEVLLSYEDEIPKDPLAELPSDMVSYEEKGASR
ncbi:Sec-independent protein secretion pathway component [Desulfosporosinus orientis DSM 765]|uniref:Sec-independent protein secretion pathway component n=1 Tax=Desulfosporosinus orientis (strain ATCC 19365 / DSM 765 / NCIMB 8382 / VKM B-1628 / Singapore I) TaxID=768706 RepID=G7WES3_DESOD|nr:twin-arginine translocase TatA/TatE family subunit [Desulfosporosinus orientis]AET66964.1 Sec-independent protein secretion pathway component [Desulfosporosinus orientis DSM 765]